jgi:hypothetical protein
MAAAQVAGAARDAGDGCFITCRFAAQSLCAQLARRSRLKDGENLSLGHHIVEADKDRLHLARGWRRHRDFHLHGFDEGDVIAIADASPDFDGKRAHAPRHLGHDLDIRHSIPPNGLNKIVGATLALANGFLLWPQIA